MNRLMAANTESELFKPSGRDDVRCSGSREDLLCKKNESNQGESVEDEFAHKVDHRPVGDVQVGRCHAGEGRAEGGCEAVNLAPGRTR